MFELFKCNFSELLFTLFISITLIRSIILIFNLRYDYKKIPSNELSQEFFI